MKEFLEHMILALIVTTVVIIVIDNQFYKMCVETGYVTFNEGKFTCNIIGD